MSDAYISAVDLGPRWSNGHPCESTRNRVAEAFDQAPGKLVRRVPSASEEDFNAVFANAGGCTIRFMP